MKLTRSITAAGTGEGDRAPVSQAQRAVWVSPLDACNRLFSGYPLAVEHAGAAFMVLIVPAGDVPRFYTLVRLRDGSCRLRLWRSRDGIMISPGTAALPAGYEDVLGSGVPLPRHGSMFGWVAGGEVTALICVNTRDANDALEFPVFAVAPRAGTPESQWPPCYPLFGAWFWAGQRGGRINGFRQSSPVTFRGGRGGRS
jgi:hypothetical protein